MMSLGVDSRIHLLRGHFSSGNYLKKISCYSTSSSNVIKNYEHHGCELLNLAMPFIYVTYHNSIRPRLGRPHHSLTHKITIRTLIVYAHLHPCLSGQMEDEIAFLIPVRCPRTHAPSLSYVRLQPRVRNTAFPPREQCPLSSGVGFALSSPLYSQICSRRQKRVTQLGLIE